MFQPWSYGWVYRKHRTHMNALQYYSWTMLRRQQIFHTFVFPTASAKQNRGPQLLPNHLQVHQTPGRWAADVCASRPPCLPQEIFFTGFQWSPVIFDMSVILFAPTKITASSMKTLPTHISLGLSISVFQDVCIGFHSFSMILLFYHSFCVSLVTFLFNLAEVGRAARVLEHCWPVRKRPAAVSSTGPRPPGNLQKDLSLCLEKNPTP